MCKSPMQNWTAERVRDGVSQFLRSLHRAHLRKEIQAVLNCSRSKADKLVLGQGNKVSSEDLLTLDEHFQGEMLRAMRGQDEASRKIDEHLAAIRRLTR